MLPKFQISNFKFKIIPKLLFVFFLSLVSYFLFLPPAFASSSAPSSANIKSNVPDNLHNWTQTVMIETMSALTCQIAGIDPINPKQSCLGADPKTGKIGLLPSSQKGGAIGFMGNMIATLYTPPLHTADYFQNLAQSFGITKKAYAQTGTGFQSLTPLIGIWSAFRNIVYLFLVVVFVIIGLTIMLRVKIDPRTVMTIQNQIPKIIIGILAVTFSFAIAGFLIDMMWVFIYLIYGIIAGIPGIDLRYLNIPQMAGSSPFGALGAGNILNIIYSSAKGIGEFISSLMGGGNGEGQAYGALIGAALGSILFIVNPIVGAIATLVGLAGGSSAYTIGFLGGVIAFIMIAIAVLVALFRLWFTLLMAYVQILLAVVLAPFWIIGGMIPGSPISFGGWLRDIGANLLAFPTTITMFLLGKVFMDTFGNTPAPNIQPFVPPLIGNPGDPSLIGSLIGLGILLMTPNVVTMLKAALKAPKIEAGIGKALAPGLAMPGRAIGGLQGVVFGTGLEKGLIDDPTEGMPRSAIGRFFRQVGISKR